MELWIDFFCHLCYHVRCWIDFQFYRCVAQLGRALRSGRRGRGFESRRTDFFVPIFTPKKTWPMKWMDYFDIGGTGMKLLLAEDEVDMSEALVDILTYTIIFRSHLRWASCLHASGQCSGARKIKWYSVSAIWTIKTYRKIQNKITKIKWINRKNCEWKDQSFPVDFFKFLLYVWHNLKAEIS